MIEQNVTTERPNRTYYFDQDKIASEPFYRIFQRTGDGQKYIASAMDPLTAQELVDRANSSDMTTREIENAAFRRGQRYERTRREGKRESRFDDLIEHARYWRSRAKASEGQMLAFTNGEIDVRFTAAGGIGVGFIGAERQRQIRDEGWTSEHDDAQVNEELSRAAICYAEMANGLRVQPSTGVPFHWPWAREWFKPASSIRMLVKAGALIAAEIDRRLRAGETLKIVAVVDENASGQQGAPSASTSPTDVEPVAATSSTNENDETTETCLCGKFPMSSKILSHTDLANCKHMKDRCELEGGSVIQRPVATK